MPRFLTFLIVMLIAGAILAPASAPALAHEQKTAITKILFNPRTGNLEVSHRFLVHDAEHAVRVIFGKDADILAKEATQLTFAAYVTDRFKIAHPDGKEIILGLVGFELDGRFFWVYQETETPPKLTGLIIKHGALRELWPSQTNTVNIEGKGSVKTATFEGSVELLIVEFNEPE